MSGTTFAHASTTPYMIRAWHEWCTDNGFTPYLMVKVDHTVAVPYEFVQNGEIVLNIGMDATGSLHLGNDEIRFKARFAGKVRDIVVPIGRVQAIYARENGKGMSFEVNAEADDGRHTSDLAGLNVTQEALSLHKEEASSVAEGLSVVGKSSSHEGADNSPEREKIAWQPVEAAPVSPLGPQETPPSRPGGSGLRIVK